MAITSVQRNRGGRGLEVGASTLDVLGFTDNPNLIGHNKETVAKNTATLIGKAKTAGSVVNEETAEVTELLGNGRGIFAMEAPVFGKVDQFKYLGATIMIVEIVNRTHEAEKAVVRVIETIQIQIILEKDEAKFVYGCS